MLAPIANLLFKFTTHKMGLTPIYKPISRFMLHSKIVRGIKANKFLSFVAKQRFIKDQRKFLFFMNFRYTRLFYNIKHVGFKKMLWRSMKRRLLPQFVKNTIFSYKTIKYFRRMGEKVDGYLEVLEGIYHYLEKRADYIGLWILGRYKNETERFRRYKEESWIYKYSDILESLVEERGEIRILLTDKYDDEKDI